MRDRRLFTWLSPSVVLALATAAASPACSGKGAPASSTSSTTSTGSSSSGAGGTGGAGGGASCPAGTPIAPDTTDLATLLPVNAVATCAPAGSACGAPDAGIHASYRKDFFYPYSQYPEAKIPDPTAGGRVQVVTTAQATGTVTGLDLHGVDAEALLATGGLDWYHVYPRSVTAGRPVWITFHSRDPILDMGGEMDVALHTGAGDAVSGKLPIAKPLVPVTYVTTNEARDQLTVFVQNRDAVPHSVAALLVGGVDVTAAACIPKKTLAPGEQGLWTVPLCQPLAPGDAWTVAVKLTDGPTSVGAGRAISTHFPIEYWPSSHECAFPSTDPGTQAAFDDVRQKGFDTIFLQVDWSACPAPEDRATFIAKDLAPNDFYAMVGTGDPKTYGGDPRVLAVMLADEADKDLGDPADPMTGPKALAKQAEAFWQAEPGVATYAGGSRHRYAGAFDGVADIAGMDIYAAGCAPHITDVGAYPPLRAPYDYAVAVRENHMPLPAWIYAQAFNGASNSSDTDRQADPTEARVQAYGVMAAGAKGLMYFQLILKEIAVNARNAATWAELGKVNREIRAVSPYLQAGDPLGNAELLEGGPAIVEAVRAKDAIVVPVIALDSCAAPTDADCYLNRDPHWLLREGSVSIAVPLPDDFGLVDAFEIVDGGVQPVKGTLGGRTVQIHGIPVGEHRPTRLFVLAASPTVRQQVAAAL